MDLQEVINRFKKVPVSPFLSVPNIQSVGDVSDNTQNSVDVMADIEIYLTSIGTSFVTNPDGTHIHDQKMSSLCHSYAVISGLRKILRKFLENERSSVDSNASLSSSIKNEMIDRIDSAKKSMNERGKCSFSKILSVFVGCISPRTFDDAFKVSLSLT